MDNDTQRLIEALAKSNLELNDITELVAASRSKDREHEIWKEEVADAREDFIQSFFNYIELVLGEDEPFTVTDEDEKYLRDRLVELEKTLAIQVKKLNNASQMINEACKKAEKEECKCNKSKEKKSYIDMDDETISRWMRAFGF